MPTPLMKSLAKKSGKTSAQVEKMWDSVKNSLKEQGHDENDQSFYPRLVGILKKNLGLTEQYTINEKFITLLERSISDTK